MTVTFLSVELESNTDNDAVASLSPTTEVAAVHTTVGVASSSSVIVAVCTVVTPNVAFVGVPIVRMTVSLSSSNVSAVIVIVAVPVVPPAAIVIGLAVIV